MKSALQTIFGLALAITSTLCSAVTVDNLSDVDIAVQSQSLQQRNHAFRAGLKQIIFKHVGERSVFDNQQIKAALRSPSKLMNQFSYFRKNEKLYLKVQFSESKVIQLLRTAQVPIWGKNRPLTIAWIAFDDENSSALESDSSNNEFIKAFKGKAEKAALPIVLPILDFDEVTNVSVSDVKGSFVNQLQQLNQRYDVEYYTLIVVDKLNGAFHFQLKLFPQNQQGVLRPIFQLKGEAKGIELLATDIVKPLVEYFSKEYSVTANTLTSKITLEFIDVNSLPEAIEIERYINSLTTVKSAHISGLENNTLSISLDLYGNEQDMLKLLKLDPKIKAVASDAESESSIMQRYKWQ